MSLNIRRSWSFHTPNISPMSKDSSTTQVASSLSLFIMLSVTLRGSRVWRCRSEDVEIQNASRGVNSNWPELHISRKSNNPSISSAPSRHICMAHRRIPWPPHQMYVLLTNRSWSQNPLLNRFCWQTWHVKIPNMSITNASSVTSAESVAPRISPSVVKTTMILVALSVIQNFFKRWKVEANARCSCQCLFIISNLWVRIRSTMSIMISSKGSPDDHCNRHSKHYWESIISIWVQLDWLCVSPGRNCSPSYVGSM